MLAALLLAAAPAPLTCQIGEARPVACTLSDQVLADGRHRMSFRVGNRTVRFEGRRQSGWWSGQLNGRPAMGFERNRGHTVFSTADLATRFAWWSAGNEHGNY